MNAMLSLIDRESYKRERILTQLHNSSVKITTLLEVGYYGGVISKMNYTILDREFSHLIRMIGGMTGGVKQQSSGALLFEEGFFDVAAAGAPEAAGDTAPAERGRAEVPPSAPDQHRREAPNASAAEAGSAGDSAPAKSPQPARKLNGAEVKQKVYYPEEAAKKKSKQEQKDERRTTILDLVKRQKDISVKDVAAVITDCSEKTLQRELLEMVDQGALKKEGERRWSRYSLPV